MMDKFMALIVKMVLQVFTYFKLIEYDRYIKSCAYLI